jgi:hypothetical protein
MGVPFVFGCERGCQVKIDLRPRASRVERGLCNFLKIHCQNFSQPSAIIVETSLPFSTSRANQRMFLAGVYPNGRQFPMTILGIDPGANGAITVLDESGGLLGADMINRRFRRTLEDCA